VGGKSLLAALPLTAQAVGAVNAAAGASLADLQARLAGAVALQAGVALSPPSLTDLIAALQALIEQILALLAQPASPPIVVNVSAMAAVAAELQAAIGLLQAQLALAASISGTLGAGIHLYRYDGPASGLVVPPDTTPDQPTLGVVLVATGPTAQAALRATFSI
jgi:hypothetical protein